MPLTQGQMDFVLKVNNRWAEGATQQQIAVEMQLTLSTLRNRLRYYGYAFGRAGKLIALRSPTIDSLEPVA